MAEQGFILDLDTKFLKNLEQADKALSKSVDNANQMTEAFASTTLGAGRFANTIQTLLGRIGQLGGLKIDDSGFARIDTTAMSAADKVNLLIQNMSRYKAEIQNIRASGQDTWLSPLDVDSAPKLKAAISDIEEIMKTDNTLKLVDQAALSNEVKLYKSALKELQLSDDERIKNAVDVVNNSLKRINKAFKQDESSTTRATNAYTKAMAAAEGTIAQRTNKIAKLQQVEKQLAQDEAKYAKELKNVRDAIQSLTKANDEATKSSKELNENQKPLINTADQLKRAFALVFSVSAIRGYVNQMVRVRGEFELQQRALQAILGSKADADAIWEKTIALAVRSPFQIKELVTYTKQLAAYRVEADKLYETNKMLADISAGLGVDMNRLILAFGQVKAANYLRGTELRQFSEAGINILGELSDYFTNLEGRAVSVGEVFERVSKRMVTFADVEAVLKNITSKGEIFYNMQEIQAETLKGQISNLKDSIDLMLNEIGRNNENVLKGSISLARVVLDNWRTVSAMLQSAIVVYGLLTAARLKSALASGALSAANIAETATTKGLIGLLAKLTIGFKSLYAWILANPITAALAGIAALGTLVYKYIDRQRELSNAYEESVGKIIANRVESEKYAKVLIELSKRQNELVNSNKELDETSDEYKKNQEEISKIESERKDVMAELNKTSPKFVEQVKSITTNTEALSKVAASYNAELRARLALETQLSIDEVASDERGALYAKQQALIGRIESDRPKYIGSAESFLDSNRATKAQKKVIEDFLNSTEDFYIRVQKLRDAIVGIGSSYEKLSLFSLFGFSDWSDDITKLSSVSTKLKAIEDNLISTLEASAQTYKSGDSGANLMSIITSAEASEEDKTNAKNNIIDFWNSVLDDKAIEGALRDRAQSMFSNVFGFDWARTWSADLVDWQRGYNDLLSSITNGDKIPGITQIVENTTQVADQLKIVEDAIKDYANAVEVYENVPFQGVITKEQYENAKKYIPLLEQLRAFLGGYDKANTQPREEKTLANRIRLVKELYEEYKKLRKVMGHTEAEGEVSSAYQDSFALAFGGTGISLDQFDFTTVEGVIAMLNKLKPLAEKEGQEAKIALQREIGEIEVTIKVEDKERADADFAQSIEDMFSGYELSLELDKLNIPKSFAQNFFDLQAVDLKDIRARLEQELALNNEISKGRKEQVEKYLQKVKEMEANAQQDRLKDYLVYARDAMAERAKITFDGLRKIQDIELAFAPKPTDSEEIAKQKGDSKAAALSEIQRQMNESIQKFEWEEFTKSDTFISLFSDLEAASQPALDYLIAKLETFKDQWADLPLDQAKELIKLLNDAKRAIPEDSTFGELFDRWIGLRKSLKESPYSSREEADVAGLEAQTRLDEYNKIIDAITLINRLREEGKTDEEIAAAITNQYGASYAKYAKMSIDALKVRKKVTKDLVVQEQKTVEAAKKRHDDEEDSEKTAGELAKKLREGLEVVQKARSAHAAVSELLGEGENHIVESAFAMVELILQTIIFGLEMKSAMGIIGWIMIAIETIARILSGIFKAKDDRLEKKIKRIQERVEVLQKQWEKLEEAMDNAFSVQQIDAYSEAAKRNMEEQIRSYEQMIALEEDKKKTDHEKIKEWREEMEDLKEAYSELLEEGFSTATSGILDDTLGAARDFVDAWYDAFQETGDGLEGLKSNFQEMLKELISQQAALQIVGPYVDMYKDWLKRYIDIEGGDSTLTIDEAREWAQRVQSTFPEISALLENFFMGAEDLLQEQGGLSELSKGIQGVTESTAQIIEALLNSMRFYVADSNYRLQNIEAAFASSDVSRNPILNELQQHTQIIRSIESMFDSVIGRGNSVHAGSYLKVSM